MLDGSPQKSMALAIQAAKTRNLAVVIDALPLFQGISQIGGDEIVQIGHCSVRIHKRVIIAIPKGSVSGNFAAVVNAEPVALGSRQAAQVEHRPVRVKKGVGTAARSVGPAS